METNEHELLPSGSASCSLPLTFGSLFAGIGGLDRGFELAGMKCRWQVEINPFCQQVLAKHWPNVTRLRDVRECGKHNLERVDVIGGGFPCQDISNAGKCVGIDGERSGLWSEFARIVRELRPRFVVVENVAALLIRGIDRVLGDLAGLGYDAEWDVLPAFAFGVSQPRRRVFIVADCHKFGSREKRIQPRGPKLRIGGDTEASHSRGWTAWAAESAVPRMAHGIPDRLDRVAAIGNAIVPQVAEWVGRRIVDAAGRTPASFVS